MNNIIYLNFGFNKTCFRTGADGRLTYHPWAHSGPGYPIDDPQTEVELRWKIGLLNAFSLFVILPLIFLMSFILGPQICLVMLVLGMVGVWYYTRQLVSDLQQ